jgi:regulatory protein
MRSTDDRCGNRVVPVGGHRVSSVVPPNRARRTERKSPLEGLGPAERAKACYAKAVDALARTSRSRADLGRWLKDREFTPDEIEAVLSKLESAGFLDDLRFAQGFARSRLESRGFGPRRVATELARKGVSRDIITQVLEEHEDNADEPRIDAVAAKRWKSLSRLEPDVARRRLQGFLARRGFDSSEIYRVLKRL